ncbi:uncharacterized protein LY89DRAFT_776688 [Mollisia scopiformis]|uniref:2EXR domain-containing protein n=1 Tax=Mollisia scopiformis TaxID=149040 RepID=A0A194XWK1_MOLSC|nr:uncharacterized protein LY89DRAFT_776688 [Mollisia scopiformis]KUJ24608.1 hypothetical protein LY89DRAFT_776688 [Mollisia scopiformis]
MTASYKAQVLPSAEERDCPNETERITVCDTTSPEINSTSAPSWPATFHEFRFGPLSKDPKWSRFSPEHWEIVPDDMMMNGQLVREGQNCSDAGGMDWMVKAKKPPTFTCFGQLPTELRLLIWKFALPQPRVVQLAEVTSYSSGFLHQGHHFGREHLSTCWEARLVFLEHYHHVSHLQRSSWQPIEGISCKEGQHINDLNTRTRYIDAIRDTLVISIDFVLEDDDSDWRWQLDVSRIQTLGIFDAHKLDDVGLGHTIWPRMEARCPALKNFSLVLGSPQDSDSDWKDSSHLRLVEVDENLRSLQISPYTFSEEHEATWAFSHESAIQPYLTGAALVRERFEHNKEENGAGREGINLQVAFLSVEGWNDWWDHEVWTVAPKPRAPYEIFKYAFKPILP